MFKRYSKAFWFLLLHLARFLLQTEGLPASVPVEDLQQSQDEFGDVKCHVRGCHYDLQLYCLSNGAIVMGSCSLKQTLCTYGRRNGLRIASSWSVCWEATYTVDQAVPAQQVDLVKASQQAMDENLGGETRGLAAGVEYKQPPAPMPLSSTLDVEGESQLLRGSTDIPKTGKAQVDAGRS